MSSINTSTGYIRTAWPVLLLLAAVLLPTACVLWLMNQAIGNQRLLVRQKLNDAYSSQLSLVRDRLDADWSAKSTALNVTPADATAFPRIVTANLADSAIILDSSGRPLYPAQLRAPSVDPTSTDPAWIRARSLEDTDPAAAPAAYSAIAEAAADSAIAARAWQAAARSLIQSGHGDAAAELVLRHFGPASEHATDLQGRLIPADSLLMAIHFLKPGNPQLIPAASRLHDLLLDYPGMPSAQRVFIMKEMRTMKLPPELQNFPTLEAEILAEEFLESDPGPQPDPVLRRSSLPGVWKLGSTSGRVVALFRTATVQAMTQAFLSGQSLAADVHVEALPPDSKVPAGAPIQSTPAGERTPGWQLALLPKGRDPFEELASRQMTLYVWIGSLLLAAVGVLAAVATHFIRRSARLAGMKADLVATVSHELKTPLSSMQLLVDTLLEDPVFDPHKTREYLELIARENSRLSLLIANFLAFSRMERNRYTFEFASARVDQVVQAALEAAGDRFREPGCELTVDIAPHLPEIRADLSALVTALANLLDNAYKYTPGAKRITLRAFAANGGVCFEVRDNGIGIEPREIKKIFLKFYQADRLLSRAGGGCGLGLSIVRFLVEAHGGTVRVSSEPGKGSIFTVAVAAA
jgi:signal transduction histidine kinase